MKRMLVIAALLTVISAAGAGAATPAWFWVWRGTGDASAMPVVGGLDPAQGGQENMVWYTGQLAQLGTGNWWDIQSDPTYGDVTLIHHSPTGDRFDWRGYGFDDSVPPQCANHFVDQAKGSFPPGTTQEDGASCALRIKVTGFGRANDSSTRQWGAQWYWTVPAAAGGTLKMGPRQQLGLTWRADTQKIYVTHRSASGSWKRICAIADQATQGGPVSNSIWVDIWCSVKRHAPNEVPVVDKSYDYYCWYSTDGGTTWNQPIDGNPVLNFSSESNARFDINADGGSTLLEYLIDYFCIGNAYTDPGTLAIPPKPATLVDKSIGEIKASPLGTLAKFAGFITAIGKDDRGQVLYYLEQPDGQVNAKGRENGIQVWISSGLKPKDTLGNDYTPSVGDYVRVVGSLGKMRCVKTIFACMMKQEANPGLAGPKPLATINRSVGGSFNSTMLNFVPPQPASGAVMANNHGLLVTVWGRVTYADSGAGVFYIDDGSGLVDGSVPNEQVKGIRVMVDPNLWPSELNNFPFVPVYAAVTGCVSNHRVVSPGPPSIDKVIPIVWMDSFLMVPEPVQ